MSAQQRRRARRRQLAKQSRSQYHNTAKTPPRLRTSQHVYHKIMFEKKYDIKDIIIGYNDAIDGDSEISLTLFKPDDDLSPISFSSINYYRTDTNILWSKKARIDMFFNSGDTKSKLKRNSNIHHISYSNYSNLPAFVKKLVYFDKLHKQLTDLLQGIQLQTASMSMKHGISLDAKVNDDDDVEEADDFAFEIDDERDTADKSVAFGGRYTHFLSIRIRNPLITTLGTLLQEDIADAYRRQELDISTSLIQPFKFHITMNVLRLPKEQHVQKVVKLLKLLQRWLKTFIFTENDGVKKYLIGDDAIFMKCIEKYKYYQRFKEIYDKIKNNKSLPLYLEGANHFNQSVIFLDFENESMVPSNLAMFKGNRNGFILKYVEAIYDVISDLCRAYKLNVNDAFFVPHCTIMKLSKLRRYPMKRLLKYNKRNRIVLETSHNVLGNNEKVHRRKQQKVYDFDILCKALNNQNIDQKTESLQTNDMKTISLSENIMKVDFCSMLGSHLTDDGYYPIIRSLSIAPS